MGTKNKTSNSRLIFLEEDQNHHRKYGTDGDNGISYEITLDPTHQFTISATRYDPDFDVTEQLTDQELMDLHFEEDNIPPPSFSANQINWDSQPFQP